MRQDDVANAVPNFNADSHADERSDAGADCRTERVANGRAFGGSN